MNTDTNLHSGDGNESIFTRLKNHLPEMNKILAIVILVLNIFFPGIGTMCLFFICGFKSEHLVVGLIQLITAICIVGWVWSVLWGVILVTKSKQ